MSGVYEQTCRPRRMGSASTTDGLRREKQTRNVAQKEGSSGKRRSTRADEKFNKTKRIVEKEKGQKLRSQMNPSGEEGEDHLPLE